MLYFIRHTQVNVDPDVSSTKWQVSENGRIQTQKLSTFIEKPPTRILTSHEPKAVKTGELLADIWNIPAQVFPNLHEQDRGDNFFVNNHDEWLNMVADYLRFPNEHRLGLETAVQAAERMETAVRAAQAQFPNNILALVSHGRILTAFLAKNNPNMNPVSYWQALTLPAAIQLSSKNFKIIETINLK